MSIFLATRPRAQRWLGHCAGSRLILAVFACAALACSDDESPAEQTGAAGGGDTPDASARQLPGDGRERTPDFDTDTRQREPIGPEELVDTIEGIRDGIGRGRIPGVEIEDSGPPAAPVDDSDAGAN